jgi:lipoyl-dependent peroxiredoxin
MPKALGGSGDGLNPEQLFSLGYSACFLSALNLTARSNGITLPPNVRIEAQVSIGKPESEEEHGPPFGIAVDLHVKSDAKNEAHRQTLEEAVHKAHEVSTVMTDK